MATIKKSSLVTVSGAEQAVAAGGFVLFNINRLTTGCNIQHVEGGSAVKLLGPGLYLVNFDADINITATGPVTAQLVNNGEAILGAADTVQATNGEPIGLHFATLVKVLPNCPAIDNTAGLQVAISAAGTLTNANFMAVKLD